MRLRVRPSPRLMVGVYLSLFLLTGAFALPTVAGQVPPASPDASPAATALATPDASPEAAGDPSRRGQLPGPSPEGEIGVQWTATTEGEAGIPVAAGELVLMRNGMTLAAYTLADGEVAWTVERGSAISDAFFANGVAYVSDSSALVALDATTGDILWESNLAFGSVPAPAVDAPSVPLQPAVADGVAYVLTGALAYAIDAANGDYIWRHDAGHLTATTPPTVTTSTIVFGMREPGAAPTDTGNVVLASGVAVVVSEDGVNVRPRPDLAGNPITMVNAGDELTIASGPVEGEGYIWWEVILPSGDPGWVIEDFLRVDADEPDATDQVQSAGRSGTQLLDRKTGQPIPGVEQTDAYQGFAADGDLVVAWGPSTLATFYDYSGVPTLTIMCTVSGVPVIVNGTVLVACGTDLVSLNPASGDILPLLAAAGWSLSGATDDQLLVTVNMETERQLIALDLDTLSIAWQLTLPPTVEGTVQPSGTLANGMVVVTTRLESEIEGGAPTATLAGISGTDGAFGQPLPLAANPPAPGSFIRIASDTDLLAAPSAEGAPITALAANDQVLITGQIEEVDGTIWWQIDDPRSGRTGWVTPDVFEAGGE